jgi:nucleotide-binding universal stress UspA family protein
MTEDLKLILAATDFSRAGTAAARRAAQLAHRHGAALELMHAVPPPLVPERWTALKDALGLDPARMRAEALGRLQKAAARLEAEAGVPPAVHLADGRPHTAIAARAAALGAGLVVVGAHGGHSFRDLVLGTTAQRALRLVQAPVLVVRHAPLFPYEQVVIATDFSPAAGAAATAAKRLLPDAVFHLLHAVELPYEGGLYLGGASDELIEDVRREAARHATRDLEALAREVALGTDRASLRVRHGRAPDCIREYAAERDIDLVAVGAGAKAQLEAGFLGSVSARVSAEAPCDVLLVKEAATD